MLPLTLVSNTASRSAVPSRISHAPYKSVYQLQRLFSISAGREQQQNMRSRVNPASKWSRYSKRRSRNGPLNGLNQTAGKGYSSAKQPPGGSDEWSKGFNPSYRPTPIKNSETMLETRTRQKRREFLSDPADTLGISQSPHLYFLSCGTMIVHPHKKSMGEDAFFISADGTAVGVADGVGAWTDMNVDSGEYSRDLMNYACTAFESNELIADDPLHVLVDAYNRTTSKGSCTACLLALRGDVLHSANIGDSGFMILRRSDGSVARGEVARCCEGRCKAAESVNPEPESEEGKSWRMVYQSVEQQHAFNYPVQLGTGSNDYPTDAETLQVPLQAGDVVIAATDGLFDNLFVNDICAIVNRLSEQPLAPCGAKVDPPRHLAEKAARAGEVVNREWLQALSATLAREASEAASSVTRRSPFATNARKAGYLFEGGKLDDITVIASLVTCERGICDGPSAVEASSVP